MKNNLPVVGKIYKCTQRGLWWHKESLVCGVYQNKVWIDMCYGNNHDIISLEAFFRSHEELPEENQKHTTKIQAKNEDLVLTNNGVMSIGDYNKIQAETKPTIKENLTLGLSSEVREAMEGLRKILIKENDSIFFTVYQTEYTAEILRLSCHAFNNKAENLLNALDKQFNLPQENTNLGEEWGSFGAVLGNDKLESLENKESIITMKKSEFESLMAGAEKVDKVDTDIKKQTVDEFLANNKIQEKTQSYISELSLEVKEEIKELKKNIKQIVENITGTFIPLEHINFNENKELVYETLYQTQNLLNALDKKFAYTLEPREKDVLDDKIEEFNKKTNAEPLKAEDIIDNKIKESIWKPVSALKPNELVPAGFVRKNKGYQATFSITHQTVEEWEGIIKEFCSLNYFLNDYEKLKERVKKLEEK